MTDATRYKHKGGTSAQWTTDDAVLLARELGIDTTTGEVRYGDGSTAWSSLSPILAGIADGNYTAFTVSGGVATLSGSFLSNVVEDTTPQAGGNLDVQGFSITTSTVNGGITLTPNGTGNVTLGTLVFDADQTVGAGQDNFVLTYDDGTGLISLEAAAGGGASQLSDLSDVTSAAVTNRFALMADGAAYVGRALVEADISDLQSYLLPADIGVTVQGFDADTLKADTADTLTAGFDATSSNEGTKSSGTYTPAPADGNFQHIVNGGAFTLAAPSATCSIVIQVTNNASAGAITLSGFTKTDGAANLTTTDGDDFLLFITVANGFSYLNIVALQ